MIPYAIWPHDRDGASITHLQTIGLGALDATWAFIVTNASLGPDQAEFLQPVLEKAPGFLPDVTRAAFLLLRDGTEKDMPLNHIALSRIAIFLGE